MKQRLNGRQLRGDGNWRNKLGKYARGSRPRRRTWTFETLEERHYLSASPLDLQYSSLSSLNSEQAQEILDREVNFAFQVAASTARSDGTLAEADYWVVRTDGSSGQALASMTGLEYGGSYSDLSDTYLFNSAGIDPYVVDAGLANLSNVTAYYPVSYDSSGARARYLPTDELFENQWHLLNTEQEVGNPNFQPIRGEAGEDINVTPAWDLVDANGNPIRGDGVQVAVVDSGVELTHPDLVANIHPTLGIDVFGLDSNANPTISETARGDFHGTAVAGIIAADDNGFGVVGIAPDAEIVPIRLFTDDPTALPGGFLTQDEREQLALNYEFQEVDIYNHSWGYQGSRIAIAPGPLATSALRDSANFGRGGLGNIHIWASGNSAGPTPQPGFRDFGIYDSAMYDGYVSSRYTIGVGGVDHDGQSSNSDGSVTTYPEAGASILVAAPTGSYPIDLGNDFLIGSGIWTTDLTGEFGINYSPLPNGFEEDNDFLDDLDYTSRMNGTSAAAPMVSGVVALMLQANPNLSFRDVEAILIRSARQNAPGEQPLTGAGFGLALRANPWVVNRIPFFRDPVTYVPIWADVDPNRILLDPDTGQPVLDPDTGEPIQIEQEYTPIYSGVPNDPTYNSLYQLNHIFDPQDAPPPPELFTNGAGYTVSDGRGVYSDQLGYGYGVPDAELAVQLAQQWHSKHQNFSDEATYSTFVDVGNYRVRAAQVGSMAISRLKVPGAITTATNGFIDYFEEFTEETDITEDPDPLPDPPMPGEEPEEPDFPEDPSGPFSDNPPVANNRGVPSIPYVVPDDQTMIVEWVEVKLTITGNADAFDYLRIALQSPSGTVSEFNNYFQNYGGVSLQDDTLAIPVDTNPPGAVYDGGTFTWSFNTVRHWGERSDGGTWDLYFENWSDADFIVEALEILWHGQPIGAGTQRVQGNVGMDMWSYHEDITQGPYISGNVTWSDDFATRVRMEGQDGDFNFDRYVENTSSFTTVSADQNVFVNDLLSDIYMSDFMQPDGPVERSFVSTDTVRTADPTQEPFAANVTVLLLGEIGGEMQVLDQFVTGHDGNYYFDVMPGEYTIQVRDAEGREFTLLDDDTNDVFHSEWHVTTSANPLPITDLNFLIDPGSPVSDLITVAGFVYADIDGDGRQDAVDPALDRVVVYFDSNRSGQFEPAIDTAVQTDADGRYQIDVPATQAMQMTFGVVPPGVDWDFAAPVDGAISVFGQLGAEIMNAGTNFFVTPPQPPPAVSPGPSGAPGSLLGFVFSDGNQNRQLDPGEGGFGGVNVFLDTNENGMLDGGERSVMTNPNGAYFFSKVPAGTYRIEIEDQDPYVLTTPHVPMGDVIKEYHEVTVLEGGTISELQFGLFNPATLDYGDLDGPNFPTLFEVDPDTMEVLVDGARHDRTANFRLGKLVDAEINGRPSANADGDDTFGEADEDGIAVLNAANNPGGLLAEGENTIRIEVAGVGGSLNAWMDLNDDGDWDDPGEHVFVDVSLNPGVHFRTITIPFGGLGDGPIAARFRWSEFAGIGYGGYGGRGEVEDYLLATTTSATVSAPVTIAGDYDQNGTVEQADYDLWRSTFGSSSDLRADGNGDGVVGTPDYVVWRNNLGNSAGAASSASSSSYDRNFAAAAYAEGERWWASNNTHYEIADDLLGELEADGYQSQTLASGQRVFFRAPAALTASTETADDNVATDVSVSLARRIANFVSLAINDATGSGATTVVAERSVRSVEALDGPNLNLLDLAHGDASDRFSSSDDDDNAPGLVSDGDGEIQELALAVALGEDTNWRYF